MLPSHTNGVPSVTVKTSISLTDAQEAFARQLVESGRYPSLSAVLQQGLDLLRAREDADAAETAALRALLDERVRSPVLDARESRIRLERIIAGRKPSK